MSGRARLRALRLVGFKSFAEQTLLEFGPGISAVIGPNGSGKSNLADSLRWALGEQGRSLRARRSEDVIFAGSARRHATGMADVTLVIDNADRLVPIDFAELELGRRLYRSGENEYLVNRQRVRLRDVVDLLDEASLADNAFLFIGQGMVDQALSLRPEERRPLFEEVAGVRRHERRRRHAEAQLAEAEANLGRVRDILGELRPQARRLAAQAEQQHQRQGAGEALAAGLVLATRRRWSVAHAGHERARRSLSGARRESEAAARELSLAEAAVTDHLARIGQRAAAVRDARLELDEARGRLTELNLAEARLAEQAEAIGRERQGLASERATLEQRLAANRRLAARPRPPADTTAAQALLALDRELALAEAEAAEAESSQRETADRQASMRRAIDSRRAELDALDRLARETARQAAEASDAARRAEAIEVGAAAEADRLHSALDAALAAEAAAERAVGEAREVAATTEGQARELSEHAAALAERRDAHRARLAAHDAELARGEPGALVAAARRRGGRPVVEGLDVDPALRLAVEAALGPAAEAAAVTVAAVAELREERGHLVIDQVGPTGSDPSAERATAAVLAAVRAEGGGRLREAIRSDPGGTASRLLATAVWVPHLEAALAVRPSLPPGWCAVTPRGEMVAASGLVRLGRAESLLARRAERDLLEAHLPSLEAEAEAAGREAAAAAAAATAAREALDAARGVADAARRERRTTEEAERAAARLAEAAAREAAWSRAQQQRLADVATRAADELGAGARPAALAAMQETPDLTAQTAWRTRLADLRARRSALAESVEADASRDREAEDERRAATVAVGMDEERLAALDARAIELVAAESDLEARRGLARMEISAHVAAERRASARLGELDVEEADERAQLAEEERRVAAGRERMRQADQRLRAAEVAELEARLGLEALREGLLVELAALGPLGLTALLVSAGREIGPTGDQDATPEALEAALDAAVDAWAVPEDAPVPPTADAPSAARLALLRRRYHELGAGNPFAAEEYAGVRQRLAELEAQQADLLGALEATRRLIGELATRIADQFQATFASLEEAFGRRFQDLFGGGDARLVLTDPDDLAATGVEIMARPPGKKRQALAMLSGGERALTAVALLFAMLEVRPVPFCVLDEVDAALDEANVGRFTDALRGLAEQTQFIVITHNRGTIEAADALYGVTIGDDAVSRVISLRLAEATMPVAAVG